MYHAKLAIKVKIGSAYPPASGIIESKIIETPPTQPHTHTDTDGMMSDPTGAATHRVLRSTSRTKMTCPDPGAPPTPAPDDSQSVCRGRQQAIPAQKKSAGPQGALRHQQSLYDLPMHRETRRQHGGHRESSRPPVQPHQTDQTPGTGDSLPTGPDVSHLSESSPIPRPGEPLAQGLRPLKRGQTCGPQDKQRPPRSRRAPPTIFGEQLKRDVSVNNTENDGGLNSGQS